MSLNGWFKNLYYRRREKKRFVETPISGIDGPHLAISGSEPHGQVKPSVAQSISSIRQPSPGCSVQQLGSSSVPPVLNETYAVLIGIDVYDKGSKTRRTADGRVIEYANLNGCVRDALAMEQYLRVSLQVKDSHIIKLLATNSPDLSEQCSGAMVPTYNNIYKTLESFIETPGSEKIPMAKAGDKVLIHYSGHGARATTVFPDLKDGIDLDEALVPCDILNGGQYLRDIELGFLLQNMVNRGLVVTVVLDCCHSGSATRGKGRTQVRGILDIYKSHPEDDRPKLCHGITKLFLPQEPQGYTVFAACRQNELAREYETDSGIVHGALTYWLLDTLRCSRGATVSSQKLYQRVCAMIRNEFTDQTPMLSGETNRQFLDTGNVLPEQALIVQKVEGKEIELLGGTLHGVRKGAEYRIFPHDAVLRDSQVLEASIISVVKVTSTDPFTSKAIFDDLDEGATAIKPGCQAVLLSVPHDQKALFRLSSRDSELTTEFARAWSEQTVSHKWLHLVSTDEPTLKYVIAVNEWNEYEIQDRHEVKILRVVPPLPAIKVTDNNAVPRLARRMRHLAHYTMLKELENADETSILRGGITFEILGQTNSDPLDMKYQKLEDRGGHVEVEDGACILVRLHNTTKFTVNLVILSLQPLFGIDQAFPQSDFECLDPGAEKKLKFMMEIPEALKLLASTVPVIDILKAFVTLDPIILKSLCLDDINQAENKGFRGAEPAFDALENLFEKLIPQHRNARMLGPAPTKWQTMNLQIRTLPKLPQ